jgi:hypothetical protein
MMQIFNGSIIFAGVAAASTGVAAQSIPATTHIPVTLPVVAEPTTCSAPAAKNNLPQTELWPEASRRLSYLATIGEDHDGEGAAAPDPSSISVAILFVRQLPYYSPDPLVGVNTDGHAVVEFHDEEELSQVTFLPGRIAEVYSARDGHDGVWFEGSIDDSRFGLKFLNSLGFRFVA